MSIVDGLRTFLAGPPPPPAPPPPGPLTLTNAPPEPILLPAKGDAFDFRLFAVFTWHSVGMEQAELEYWARRLSDRGRRTVIDQAADIAREYEPHDARGLETRLRLALGDRSWTCNEEGASVRFQVRARVEPDERVREKLRPFWEQRIQMECQQELDLLRVKLVDQLTEEWSAILKKLEEDPFTPHAAKLSEERFANVFGDFVAERRRVVREIVDLLQDAVTRQGTLGLGPSEYTQAWDDALKAFRRKFGLDTT